MKYNVDRKKKNRRVTEEMKENANLKEIQMEEWKEQKSPVYLMPYTAYAAEHAKADEKKKMWNSVIMKCLRECRCFRCWEKSGSPGTEVTRCIFTTIWNWDIVIPAEGSCILEMTVSPTVPEAWL